MTKEQREAMREYHREYRAKNREKLNEYYRKYYEQNKDKIREKRKHEKAV